MTALRERPRAAAAAAIAAVIVLALAMLAGGALADADSSPATGSSVDASARVRAEHALTGAHRDVSALRSQLRAQSTELARTQAIGTRWRNRATRAERQLAKRSKGSKRGGSRGRSR